MSTKARGGRWFCWCFPLAAGIALASGALRSQELDPAPAGAQRFALLSASGIIGSATAWTSREGTRTWRETTGVGAQRTTTLESIEFGMDGMPRRLTVEVGTGTTQVVESFRQENRTSSWTNPYEEVRATVSQPAFYVPATGSVVAFGQALLEAVLAAPGHSLALMPEGTARAEQLATRRVGVGAKATRLVLWGITGLTTSPIPLWATSDGRFFASIEMPSVAPAGFVPTVIPEGYEHLAGSLLASQLQALAARSARLARTLRAAPSATIVFHRVRAFVGGRFVDDQTVVVSAGRVVSVGPAASVSVPASARVIEGAGRTLVPGLWDYHHHVTDDAEGLLLLSLGVTSLRDPSNNDRRTVDRSRRRSAGKLLFPNVHASALIDGPGPYSTNTRASWVDFGSVVSSESEAKSAVRRAKARGFGGIKLYGSLKPDWLGATVREAHRLGLRVHGHLPSGMRPSEAIAAGYDELTHAYYLMLEAMPDTVVASSHTRNRFEGNGRYAKDVELDVGPMSALIRDMARNRIAADPTLVVVEWLLTGVNGAVARPYLPYAASAPPMMQRRFRMGGVATQGSLQDRIASFRRDCELVGAMHRAGVQIAAGTDSSGLELVAELELYVQSGLTPAQALESATIVPARLLGLDRNAGSIEVGKVADLVLVEGDPSSRIGDLRNTRYVVLGGNLYDADVLRAASGFSGRPQ